MYTSKLNLEILKNFFFINSLDTSWEQNDPTDELKQLSKKLLHLGQIRNYLVVLQFLNVSSRCNTIFKCFNYFRENS